MKKDNFNDKMKVQKPKRPLSAYNFYFKFERARILSSIEDAPSPSNAHVREQQEEETKKGGNTSKDDAHDLKGEAKSLSSKTKHDEEVVVAEEQEGQEGIVTTSTPNNDHRDDKENLGGIHKPTSEALLLKDQEQNEQNLSGAIASKETSQGTKKKKQNMKPHRKISFANLGKTIGSRWAKLNAEEMAHYKYLADKDMERYKRDMQEYLELLETLKSRGHENEEEEDNNEFERREMTSKKKQGNDIHKKRNMIERRTQEEQYATNQQVNPHSMMSNQMNGASFLDEEMYALMLQQQNILLMQTYMELKHKMQEQDLRLNQGIHQPLVFHSQPFNENMLLPPETRSNDTSRVIMNDPLARTRSSSSMVYYNPYHPLQQMIPQVQNMEHQKRHQYEDQYHRRHMQGPQLHQQPRKQMVHQQAPGWGISNSATNYGQEFLKRQEQPCQMSISNGSANKKRRIIGRNVNYDGN